jgi:hypothetical protein
VTGWRKLEPRSWNWLIKRLAVIEDFRTFGWVEKIRFPKVILDKSSLLLN